MINYYNEVQINQNISFSEQQKNSSLMSKKKSFK